MSIDAPLLTFLVLNQCFPPPLRVADLSQELSLAKSRYTELEARSKALQAKNDVDKALHANIEGNSKRKIAELEASLTTAKLAAESSARSALELQASYQVLSLDFSKAIAELNSERAVIERLKVAADVADQKARDAANTVESMKNELVGSSYDFERKLATALSAAQLAEGRRIVAERK